MSCAFGFDVGSKLIGVAVGNSFTASARGLSVLAMREDQPDWPVLDDLRAQWLPDTLVVGLPLTLDGAEQPASHRARRFAERLHARYELPVLLVDERLPAGARLRLIMHLAQQLVELWRPIQRVADAAHAVVAVAL